MGRPYGLIPVGLPALVNVLQEAGIRVQGLVFPLEKQRSPAFSLKEWLRRHPAARVILIDLHWYEHCYGAVETALACKEVLPSAWTVLGGLTATGFAREILEQFPQVDFIVRGDAEKPLLELVQLLLSDPPLPDLPASLQAIPNLSYRAIAGAESSGAVSSEVVENPLAYTAATDDLDRLDFINLDFLEHSQDYLVHEYIVTDLDKARRALETDPFKGRWTTTARGCKFHCSYCGGSKESHKLLAGRNGIIARSPEKVVEDLVRLKAQGVHQASLSYDIEVIGEDYWRAFFSGLRASGVRIGVYNEFFQMPSRAFVEDYVRSVDMAHSCVALSPLSGNERVRRLNGKHYSNDQLFEMLELLARYKSYIFVYFSMNLPGEDSRTFEETLEIAQSIYDFYPSSYLKILNTVHTLDPLSPMNMYADKYGIQAGLSSFRDYYEYCRATSLGGQAARTELHRGFALKDPGARSIEAMADAWDRARQGREGSWWPVPPSW
jgi:clorobiocin biosynthesis protein CloN6